jgi:hypothetical protein
MCHRASESTAGHCACGYAFGQDIDTVQRLLRNQLRSSTAATAALSILHVSMFTLLVFGQSILGAFAIAALARTTLKSARKMAISRESLRQLAPRQLPTAKLLT